MYNISIKKTYVIALAFVNVFKFYVFKVCAIS